MQKRDYNATQKYTGNTETHMAIDERLKLEDPLAYEEGFAAASGVRADTAATGGRIKHPETKDHAKGNMASNHLDEENAGLAE